MRWEGSSHHSKSQGPDVTALKQGHFFSPINHVLDVAKAITACALILKVFPLPFALPAEFQSLSLSPLRILQLIAQKSEITLHWLEAAGGFFYCTPVTNTVIFTFYHDPLTPLGQHTLSEREWTPPPFPCPAWRVHHNQVGNFTETSSLIGWGRRSDVGEEKQREKRIAWRSGQSAELQKQDVAPITPPPLPPPPSCLTYTNTAHPTATISH